MEEQSLIQLVKKTVLDNPGSTTKEITEHVSHYRPSRIDVVNRALERLKLRGEISRVKSAGGVLVNHPNPERFGTNRTMNLFNSLLKR